MLLSSFGKVSANEYMQLTGSAMVASLFLYGVAHRILLAKEHWKDRLDKIKELEQKSFAKFYEQLDKKVQSGEVKSAFAAKLKNLLASKMKFATQRLSAVMNPMTPKQDTVADFFQVMVETNMKYKVRQTKKGGRCQDSI